MNKGILRVDVCLYVGGLRAQTHRLEDDGPGRCELQG